jgi:hypothetical protein
MINVARTKAWLATIKGDIVAVPRAQMDELLSEVEVGQHARRSLTNIRSVVVIAASTAGAPL